MARARSRRSGTEIEISFVEQVRREVKGIAARAAAERPRCRIYRGVRGDDGIVRAVLVERAR